MNPKSQLPGLQVPQSALNPGIQAIWFLSDMGRTNGHDTPLPSDGLWPSSRKNFGPALPGIGRYPYNHVGVLCPFLRLPVKTGVLNGNSKSFIPSCPALHLGIEAESSKRGFSLSSSLLVPNSLGYHLAFSLSSSQCVRMRSG